MTSLYQWELHKSRHDMAVFIYQMKFHSASSPIVLYGWWKTELTSIYVHTYSIFYDIATVAAQKLVITGIGKL